MGVCGALGMAYAEGWGVARNDTLAVQLYQRACDGGVMIGCFLLGGMYREGRGVARNDTLAVKLFHRACDGGVQGACERVRALGGDRPTPPQW
jgi:TPR repeat protein